MKIIFHIPYNTSWGQQIYITGSIPELGAWDVMQSKNLTYSPGNNWTAELEIPKINFEYKYIIKEDNGNIICEIGDNRSFLFDSIHPDTELIELHDSWHDHSKEENVFQTSAFQNVIFKKQYPFTNIIYKKDPKTAAVYENKFTQQTPWKGAGIAIPIFSLRTKNSLGTGEFLDIKLLSDWAHECGFQAIQILPINDTSANMTWLDSYPYSSISVFALHPLYLNLESLGKLTKKIQDEINEGKKILNAIDHLDYENVIKLKMKLIKEIFEINKEETLKSADFKNFFEENSYWLKPYAAFCYLRDKYKTCEHTKWEKYSNVTAKDIESITSPKAKHFNEIVFYYFVQYHLHVQLLNASEYAKSKGIILKGDIAIGIKKQSDSCWVNPELFNMDQSAGAPPDPFSDVGQNWSFPTYNWERMSQDNYLWWKQRLKQMSRYFQMVRLDHVLGFFRIWEIPDYNISGLLGHFNPAIPLSKNELEENGIWDFDRLCNPFIPLWLLKTLFKDETNNIIKEFLEETSKNYYKFKPEFSTQKQIENYFKFKENTDKEKNQQNNTTKNSLSMLLSNIILLKDKHGTGFHPRINMMDTPSFACLEEWMKEKLKNLYYDYFYNRQNDFWRQQGMIKLPLLKQSSDMLICGEDLGMIPDCVPLVMEELSILGLRIQRMPKETNLEFSITENYPYLTVCTTSSHDMSTIRGWWEEDSTRTKRYYNKILGHEGTPPASCTPEICKEIITQHIKSPSMWAIFPIQDILSMSKKLERKGDPKEEQINDPANPNHLWKFRLHINIEELIKNKEFSDGIKEILKQSMRCASNI
jgi:4-alpha-glucanotransferase